MELKQTDEMDSHPIIVTPVSAFHVQDGDVTYTVVDGLFYRSHDTSLVEDTGVNKRLRDRVADYMRIPVVSRREGIPGGVISGEVSYPDW